MESTERALRAQICEIGTNLWTRHLVAANDGNISARLPDGRLLCTPTGVSKGYLRPDLLATVDLDGHLLDGQDGPRPSSELKMHLRVYQLDESVGAVVHAHPPYATAFAVMGEPLTRKLTPETVVAMPEVPLAPYGTPSTPAVPDSIEPFVLTHSACLLEFHGALTWGQDLRTAYLAMERLEFTAQLTYLLRLAGAERELPAEEIAHVAQVFGVHLP